MSSYVTAEDIMDYHVKRHPDFHITTTPEQSRGWLQRLAENKPIFVNTPAWCGDAYVMRVENKSWPGGHEDCTVTLRPTGAPKGALRAVDKETGIAIRVINDMHFGGGDHMFGYAPTHTITDDPHGPGHTIDFKPKKETPLKIRHKYYVAADKVSSHFEQDARPPNHEMLATPTTNNYNGAGGKWTRKDLKGAIEHAEQILDKNPAQEHVVIVKMVRIVRRKKAPVVVEVL